MDKPKGFDLKYLLVGEGAKDWYKALGNGWRILVLFLLGLVLVVGIVSIKNALFPKPGDNVHKPTFIALPGSTVGNVDLHSEQKQEAPKRPWWRPIPYVAVYGAVETRKKGSGQVSFDEYDPCLGAQAGLRWDF